jgi:hypothetical protein
VDSSGIKWHVRKWRSVRSGRIGRRLKTVVKKIKLTNILCSVNFIVDV